MSNVGDCPICQLKMILPTALPGCGHEFCFICIKGACMNNPGSLCPMCRGPIDKTIFAHPVRSGVALDMRDPESPPAVKKERQVKDEPGVDAAASGTSAINKTKKYWLYEGRHGWWRFDPRQEKDIAQGLEAGMPILEICVCGCTYIIDFQRMVQYKKDVGISQKRAIKCVEEQQFRALKVKGIAGVAVTD